MGLHLHRKLTAVLIALFMLTSFQAPAVFGADEESPDVQETTQVEEIAEPETKAEEPAEEPSAEPAEESAPAEDMAAQPTTEQSSNSAEEPKDSNAGTARTVDISFTLLGETEEDKWIEETKVSLPEGSTVKDAIEKVFEDTDNKCDFNEDGAIRSISFRIGDGIIALAAGESNDASKWICRINSKDYEEGIDKYELNNNDTVLVYYAKTPEEELNSEETGEDAAAEEEEPELSAFVKTTAGAAIDNSYGNTRDKAVKTCEAAGWSSDAVWYILGLARAGELTAEQAQKYLNSIIEELNKTGDGKLNESQSTYNSRAILSLTAAGVDVSNVGGYNLLEALSDIDYVKRQGMNGLIWALLAFDSKNYEIPANQDASKQTTRERLVDELLSIQKNDGGWAFGGNKTEPSDVDVSSMTITALAPYYNSDERVKTAIDKALSWLSSAQNGDGTFGSYGIVNSESISQVIVALASLGIDPASDERFIKNGVNPIDALNSFYTTGGGFKHISSNTGANGLASMQGYYALVAYYRSINGKNSLYDMTDAGDDFLIEVDYTSEKIDENGDNNGNSDSDASTDGNSQINDIESGITATGVTKGITKAAGLIKLKGMTENAKKSISLIEAVVKRGLSEDASTYTEDDIKAINEAYRAYLDLQAAEKLAVEKDENWKKFSKLTAALGAVYHIDREWGVDVLDNNDIIMPWYVKLVVKRKNIAGEQTEKILNILGEGSQLSDTLDISFQNTLTEENEDSQWHPSNILTVNMCAPDTLKDNKVIIHITDEDKIEFIKCETVKDEENRYEDYGEYSQFQSDDFSIYGVAGTTGSIKKLISSTEEEEPSTGYLMWIYIGVAALAALALIMILRRRSEQSKETDQ